MASTLQNRLVGTVILVALAVIILPDILDGEKQSNKDLFVDLPPKPTVKALVEPRALQSDEIAQDSQRQIELVDEVAVDDEPATVAESSAAAQNSTEQAETVNVAPVTVASAPQVNTLPGAGWVIQLGSFRHQQNVRSLLEKLENAGYRAYSRPVKTTSGTLTKVFVGPDLQKEKLEKALPHLQQLTQLKGRLTPFTVD